MNLQNKIVFAHRGYFNAESKKKYRENSKQLYKISTTKDYIRIIDMDVRKSKDGILYCYHGTFFQCHFSLRIPRNFSEIKKKYGVDSSSEILEVIREDKSISLDIKSKSITKADILKALEGKKFKEVILGNNTVTSVQFLERFNDMPVQFVKTMNGNVLHFLYDLKKLKDKNFKYYEVVFPFQVNKKVVEDTSRNGLIFGCIGLFFLSRKSYWKKINKYNIKLVSTDFI